MFCVFCISLQNNEVGCRMQLFLSHLFQARAISVITLCITLSCTRYIMSCDEAAEWNWDWIYVSLITYLSIPLQWLSHDWRDTGLSQTLWLIRPLQPNKTFHCDVTQNWKLLWLWWETTLYFDGLNVRIHQNEEVTSIAWKL